MQPLRQTPAWTALEDHAAAMRDTHLRDLFAADPGRGERLDRRGGRALPRLLEAPGDRRDDRACSLRLARGARPRGAHRRHVPRASTSTSPRTGPCCTWRSARRRARRSSSTARTSCPRCTRCSTAWPRSPTASARASGRATPASAIRNVVNIGIGGSDLGPVMAYEALRHYTPARPDVPVRVERRRHRLRRGDARPRPRGDALHRLVEDVHDARDDDERDDGARVDARRPRRRVGGRAPLRRRLDERRGRGRRSASTPTNMFGFWDWVGGRYSMDSAIGLSTMIAVGPERVPASCWPASTRWTSTSAPRRSSENLPVLDGAARGLVRRLLRRSDASAVLPYDQYLKRFPAYLQQLDDGVERQVGDARRRARRLRDRARRTGASRARTASTPSTS